MPPGDDTHSVRLETERLLLRNIQHDDLDFLLMLWTDPDVTRYMGGPREPQRLREMLEADIREPYRSEYDLWILTDKRSGERIGHCGLLEKTVGDRDEIEIEIVYVIDKSRWGSGYAGEIAQELIEYAFADKGLRSVIALIVPENTASARVARRVGMVKERDIVRPEKGRMHLYRRTNRSDKEGA